MSGVPRGTIHLREAYDRLWDMYQTNDPLPPWPEPPREIDQNRPGDETRWQRENETFGEQFEAYSIVNKRIGEKANSHLLGALISGELVAYERDPGTGNHLTIRRGWWENDAFPEQNFKTDAIVATPNRPRNQENYRGKVFFIDQEPFDEWLANLINLPLTRSGLPGRPSAKYLYIEELERRAKNGHLEPRVRQQATALHDWLRVSRPGHNPSTVKAIENNIRDIFKRLRADSRGRKAPK